MVENKQAAILCDKEAYNAIVAMCETERDQYGIRRLKGVPMILLRTQEHWTNSIASYEREGVRIGVSTLSKTGGEFVSTALEVRNMHGQLRDTLNYEGEQKHGTD